MILEAIVTTLNADGSTNFAPMGPQVNADFSHWEMRPFQTSSTFANLKRTGQAVVHVTDDVELIARAAIGKLESDPETTSATAVDGRVIVNACRYYELQSTFVDESQPRASIQCRVVHAGRLRDFFGLNRGKHAVLEAAVLATRVDFLPLNEIVKQFVALTQIVGKTGAFRKSRQWRCSTRLSTKNELAIWVPTGTLPRMSVLKRGRCKMTKPLERRVKQRTNVMGVEVGFRNLADRRK